MKSVFLTFAVLFFLVPFTAAQTCETPKIVANAKTDNFFTPEQEMILGELTLQRLVSEFRPLRDQKLLSYVETIGNRLIKHLPDIGIRYQFHIIDYPEANAFNIPGGHVFLSRKLIAFSNSEDEVASVIAHELGHAVVRHGAQDMSTSMRKVLNISSVGDRKDIIEKYNLLIENARTKRAPSRRGHEGEQQLEADKLGFYAMVAAGYDPNASFTFFDRLTESEGKTGSWFSDLFGNTRPEQKRLRELADATQKLPQECRDGRSATATDQFLRWQADVVFFRDAARKEDVPGLMWKKELEPKLRSDVRQIEFSTDGKYLVVADDYSVTVLEREGLKVLRQIPVNDVSHVYLTAGDTQLVLTTDGLRFERWDIASGDVLEVRELVLRRDCWEHSLSPDGNYLACVDLDTNLNVIETKTGKRVWEKKKFYDLSIFEYIVWIGSGDDSEDGFFRIGFTPDSKNVVFSRSNKFRFRFRIDGMTVDQSDNTAVGVDLRALKQIDLGGSLKKIAAQPYAFIADNRIVGSTDGKLESGGVFSFPDGKRIEKLTFGGENITPTADPNYVVVKPLADGSAGIYDIARNAVVVALKKDDLAIWKDMVAFESVSGKVVVRKVSYDESKKGLDGKDVASVDLPAGRVSEVDTAEVSDDFGWVALSSESRGGIWNLKTGERKVFTRGFRSGVVDNSGRAVASFPGLDGTKHSLALLDATTGQGTPVRELPEYGVRQYGRFLLQRTSLKDDKSDNSKSPIPLSEEEKANLRLRSDVKIEIHDWLANKVIWSREFKGAVPRLSFDPYSGRVLFFWRLSTDEGKARLKENVALKAKAESLEDKTGDYLIDVIDSFEGRLVGNLLLETGKGSFSIRYGQSERDWLVVNDSQDRVLVYSLSDGTLRHRFFGSHAAVNPMKNQLVVENVPGELALYSLDTGDKIADFVVGGGVSFSRFSLDGNRLFIFSDQQVGFAIDLTKVKAAPKQVIF
ncbi:MAG: M48 family metalloprotease [Pyrinomonadaceae bacterium]|nr:M48 family metalloprotease [Pyrinomonadaceae bacterium]